MEGTVVPDPRSRHPGPPSLVPPSSHVSQEHSFKGRLPPPPGLLGLRVCSGPSVGDPRQLSPRDRRQVNNAASEAPTYRTAPCSGH